MQPPASYDDLNLAGGQTYPVDRAMLALRLATSALVADLGWDPEESERVWVEPGGLVWAGQWFGPRTVFLPALHVTALAVTAGASNAVVSPRSWADSGMLHLPGTVGPVTVTYTAGWPVGELPGVFELAVLDYARAVLDVQTAGVRSASWTVGAESESVTYAGEGSAGPSMAGDVRLDAYRLGVPVA